jgi:hypothetical protein
VENKNSKLPYNTPKFERYGSVRDLTLVSGHNVPSSSFDNGQNNKTLGNFFRTH